MLANCLIKSEEPTPKYKLNKKFLSDLITQASGATEVLKGKEIPNLQKSKSPKNSKKTKARKVSFDVEALYLIFFCLILFSFIIITHAP